jgi:hypothetical protein
MQEVMRSRASAMLQAVIRVLQRQGRCVVLNAIQNEEERSNVQEDRDKGA